MTQPILLEPTTTICARHGEVFKPRWPVGYGRFATTALECLTTQPDFAEEVRRAIDDESLVKVTGDVRAINYLLQKKPICCRLPKDDLLEVYLEIQRNDQPWVADVCATCGERGIGCEYRKARPRADARQTAGTWRHVCLRCVTHGQSKT